MARAQPSSARCSFCGRPHDQVRRLIAGPGVTICDRCVEVCNEVLANGGAGPEPPARRTTRRPSLPPLVRTWLRNVFRSAAPNAG